MSLTMTTNRFSTHGPDIVGGDHVCPYKKCEGRGFKNAQALNMHIGRVHTKVIPTASSAAVSRGLARARKENHRSILTDAETDKLVSFICKHHTAYPTKKAAFDAAMSATGLKGKIKAHSSAVDRYWKKADELMKQNNGASKPKRKYTRRAKAEPTIPLIPTNPGALECLVTGPGLRIEFSAKILPTILHTIAMSIGDERTKP